MDRLLLLIFDTRVVIILKIFIEGFDILFFRITEGDISLVFQFDIIIFKQTQNLFYFI